ncbi:MAG: Cation diffusion facilitator family transporter [Verrucomicrobiales bacterium]|nr:Cation diffusion facilitator family transporter [Verrucomicrobiales bacterium]
MPKTRLSRSLRATFVGMAVNALLASGKLVAGIVGNSYALIADAVESISDIFSSLIVWRALVVAAAPADEEHPYGHGKAEPIAAAIISTFLLLASVGIAIQAVHRIVTPEGAPRAFTLWVLLVTIVIKEGLFRFVFRESVEIESDVVRTDAWHHRSDAITSLAAFIGISFAVFGGKRFESADSIAAIVAAGIIAWNGFRLLRPAMNELMDAAPSRNFSGKIEEIARGIPGVDDVEKCFVRKMGYHYFVDMHLEVNPEMTVQVGHDIAHKVKDEVRRQLPAVFDVLVHIEPSGRPHRKK